MNAIKTLSAALLMIVTSAIAACSDAPGVTTGSAGERSPGATTSDSGFGDLAFSTYRGGKDKLVFVSDSKVKKTWKNMRGAAVYGTYAKTGRDVVVEWDPNATNHGSLSAKYRQLGPCSLANYQRVDKEGAVHDELSKVLEREKPRCNEVKLSR